MSNDQPPSQPKADTHALILSGGGARAAYQVGVLSAIGKMLPKGSKLPFPILCGTSAGALNACMLATNAHDFTKAVSRLNYIWRHLTPDNVYETKSTELFSSASKVFSSMIKNNSDEQIVSLLNNAPLEKLLQRFLPLNQIEDAISEKELHALAITCMSYTTGETTTFFEGNKSIKEWSGFRRNGKASKIDFAHLLASSAIPTIFPAQKIGQHFYGDGAMRQRSPISPAIQLGANKIMVIGVSGNRNPKSWTDSPETPTSPSMGQITGQLLNSAFIDNLEGDIQQLEYINTILSYVEDDVEVPKIKHIDSLIISPSQAIDEIADKHISTLPKSIRFLLNITGNNNDSSGNSAASYLLFTPEYCQELIELGQQDAMWEKDKILAFLK
ncbi:patatin-like phospholipase family protein [Marinomonas sp. 15G1-11]|uniref:Patatin-like phospholipase family protein n=1 Tax=Marinomonas phaeophyticola TaxID=3004091 RepID=A0ABT4JZG2_9GAMM|nr:patatin-like phospholipase family protein [Marinomonas sp. 15G1-11]MCZ2723497.1 patatin-like phospholipase family protein [Marinomonas sp. 15G1-11]